MLSVVALGTLISCLWHFAQEASVIFTGSIGKSHRCGASQWYFFSQSSFCFSSLGMCAASRKLTDWPMPSWHTVQPILSIGCAELPPRYVVRSGCVVNGCGYFS